MELQNAEIVKETLEKIFKILNSQSFDFKASRLKLIHFHHAACKQFNY